MYHRLIAILVLLSLLICGCSLPTANAAGEHPAGAMETGLMRARQYYALKSGLLVPVERRIPLETDYAGACLSLLASSETNDAVLSAKRLVSPLPAGVDLKVSLQAEGLAIVDVCGMGELSDSAQEKRAVEAVIATALALSDVRAVELLFEGVACQKLKHGTDVSGTFTEANVNPEDMAGTTVENAQNQVTLWYRDAPSGLLVPVTRRMPEKGSPVRAIEELIKGTELPLENPFPKDALLLSLTQAGGSVTLDFSVELKALSRQAMQREAALKALFLTLSEFIPLKKLTVRAGAEEIGSISGPVLNEI